MFQRSCHVHPHLDILFGKLKAQIVLDLKSNVCTICLTGLGFHARHVFFFNTFSGDLYIDALIKGSFTFTQLWVRLLGKVHFKRCLLVDWVRMGSQFSLGVCGQEETMYNPLSQLSYLWDLHEQKRWGRFYSHDMGIASRKEVAGGHFL